MTTTKTGYSVQLRFSVNQHSRDHQLINSFIKINCGTVMVRSTNESIVEFIVSSLEDIINKIIPFFDQFPLHGVKRLDYADFCRVVTLMKDKAHLTVSGLEQIRLVKSNMNRGRQ
jgi:hypothetical protein